MYKKILAILVALIAAAISMPAYAASNFDVNKEDLVDFPKDTESMQRIVKTIAQEYAYKGSYTDYEQKSMDVAKINGMSGTAAFRNFDMNPFVLSKTNNNTFDCSSFVTNVYMNAFGYSFSDLMDRSTLYTLTAAGTYARITSANYRDPLLNSGKGVSTALLQRAQRNNKKLNGKNSLFVKTFEKKDGYYTEEDYEGLKDKLSSVLQTGDILLIRRSKPADKVTDGGKTDSGHVLLYVKDYVTQKTNEGLPAGQVENLVTTSVADGFIHSTGSDYPMDKVAKERVEEYGDKDVSVHFGSLVNYLKNEITKSKYVNYISVIRPINIIQKGDYENIYTQKRDSLKTTKNILALSNMPQITMQQYMYNRTDSEYIRNTNTINVGDVVRVKNYFKNRGCDPNGVQFTVSYPIATDGFSHADKQFYWYSGKYNKKVTKRTFKNNTLTYSITLYPGQYIYTYYDVTYAGKSSKSNYVTIPGMTITYGDQIIVMDDMVASVNTYDDSKLLAGFDRFYGKRGTEKRKISLYEAYQSVTGFKFSDYFNYDSEQTFAQNTKNIIFSYFEYDTGGKTLKANSTRGMRKNSNTKANGVVINGYYGGTMVRSDAKDKRIRKPSFKDLEPGDMVIVYTDNKHRDIIDSPAGTRSKYAFVYLGDKAEIGEDGKTVKYPICYYEISGEVYKTIKTSYNKINRILAEDSYIVIRPTKVLSKTNKISLANIVLAAEDLDDYEEVESDDDVVDEDIKGEHNTSTLQEVDDEKDVESDSNGAETNNESFVGGEDEDEIDTDLDEIKPTDVIGQIEINDRSDRSDVNLTIIIVAIAVPVAIIMVLIIILVRKKLHKQPIM